MRRTVKTVAIGKDCLLPNKFGV